MPEVLKAMSISGAILLGVVVLMIVVSVLAVNRGSAAMEDDSKHGGHH